MLCAALQGGSFLKMLTGVDRDGEPCPYRLGQFFLAINPESFLGLEGFEKTCGDILRELRASRKAPGLRADLHSARRSTLCWLERKDKGVPMAETVQREVAGGGCVVGIWTA